MVKAYETNIGPITVKKQDTGFYDATEETCEKAVAADLMYAYPSAATFSPELEVRMEILPEWIQDFTMSYMTAWYDPDRQLGDALYAPLTYQQMVHSVAQLGALYENRPVPQLETSQQTMTGFMIGITRRTTRGHTARSTACQRPLPWC